MTAAHLQHLHQVALNCSDLQLTIKFYRDVLGLSLIAEFSPPGIAFFQLGQTRLMVQQVAGAAASSSVLYFAVEDVNSAQAALVERGAVFEAPPHLIHRDTNGTFGPKGIEEWMSFFKDPNGNVLALCERKATVL